MKGNTITVVGNLTKDPELTYLPNGKAVTNFSVASNHGWFDKATSTWVDGTASFFKVACWEAMAENVAEGLRRGDPVIVLGRLDCRTYEQQGQTRESWEIRAETVGPDMRWRAVSLRRVNRTNQPADQASPDGPGMPEETAELAQQGPDAHEGPAAPEGRDLEWAPPAPDLARAS